MKTKDLQDDIHANFGQLLRELNKQDAPYALSVANRLYGEQSYQFHKVCVPLALVDEVPATKVMQVPATKQEKQWSCKY